MAVFLNKINAAPLNSEQFSFEFNSWLSVMIGEINEDLTSLENFLNLHGGQHYTDVQINALFVAGALVDGILLYDTVNNVYVGMEAGSLVKFTTTPYP